jgi:SET domain-containing protein
LSDAERDAANALFPKTNSGDPLVDLLIKFKFNSISCSEDGDRNICGLFLNMSRINHECIGNTTHWVVPELESKLLMTNTDMKAGEEITFSYISFPSGRHRLMDDYEFKCRCRTCGQRRKTR